MLHTPGPLWISGLDFREQPGIADHVNHYRGMLEEGRLYLGGPFLAVDAGGMMITRTGLSREEVEAYAADDPAVAAGLLRYEIRSWYVVMDANR